MVNKKREFDLMMVEGAKPLGKLKSPGFLNRRNDEMFGYKRKLRRDIAL